MLPLLLAVAVPETDARAVIEWQLRSPPRTEDTGLSAQEAQAVSDLYLQSIGQRPPQRQDADRGSP